MSEMDTDVPVAEEAPTTADGSITLVPQVEQLKNPDARIVLEPLSSELLGEYCTPVQGLTSGDNPRFLALFWEVADINQTWTRMQAGATNAAGSDGRELILRWEHGHGELVRILGEGVKGRPFWGCKGLLVRQISPFPCSWYESGPFDMSATALIPRSESDLLAIRSFCEAPSFAGAVRKIDQKLNATTATLAKVSFDLAYWQKVAAEKYPNGLPEPQSDDPTQWLFHGHPAGRVPLTTDPAAHAGTVLQVAVARLAGYRWPAELDPQMRLAPEARAWVEKCKELDSHADDDGVIPLAPMRGEPAAEGRVRDLLRAAFGSDWTSAKETALLAAAAAANGAKSPAANLDDWLKNRFFAEHCALFHHRPFVWHIWDGRKKDGFGVLVQYHRLAAPNGQGRRLLEKITHGYLGDWIARQRDEVKAEKTGAEGRLADALELQEKLEAILEGEPPYDIFVRWKPLHEQPIGWEPDINDGVRMNIRPFVAAGVLREKVNIKWKTDRGHEPEKLRPKADFPWFWDGKEFKGDRVNDGHLTNDEKQQARDAKRVP